MSFDIQYLLWLQDLRNATGGMFDEFFNALSKFAVDILPFLPYPVGNAALRLPMLTAIGAAIMFAWKELFASATIVQAFGGHWVIL